MNNKYILIVVFLLGISAESLVGMFLGDDIKPVNISSGERISNTDFILLQERMDSLDTKTDSLMSAMDNIDEKMNNLLSVYKSSESTEYKADSSDNYIEEKDNNVLSHQKNEQVLTPGAISAAKEQVYNKLADTSLTLPDILNSQELNSLPQNEKEEVLTELARRLDSGEIDKAIFLPGYRAD